MVCGRCIQTVRRDLEELDINFNNIELGSVQLNAPIDDQKKSELSQLLESQGFALLEDKNSRQIEIIKNLILEWVRSEKRPNVKFSNYIAEQLHSDYNQLSSLFPSVEGITIEKYMILQKIEYAKELLFYDELTLSEISYKLGYSSVHYLSNQFKKVTGMSPSDYKNLRSKPRNPLDRVT